MPPSIFATSARWARPSRAITRQPIAFEIAGAIGVSAGPLGMQTLGPMTWLRGELR